MLAKRILFGVGILAAIGLSAADVSAQGGWRQWEIHFQDGTSIVASPLQLRPDARFTGSMDPKEPGYERSKIDYFAIVARDLPAMPKGNFKKDLVVMMDGTRTLGPVKFVELSFSEGKIIQNGKEIGLGNVAYIKFAHPKPRPEKSK